MKTSSAEFVAPAASEIEHTFRRIIRELYRAGYWVNRFAEVHHRSCTIRNAMIEQITDRAHPAERIRIACLLCLHTVICCVSLAYAADGTFQVSLDPAPFLKSLHLGPTKRA